MPNISEEDLKQIAARTSFKYEDEYATLDEAITGAMARSMKSFRNIYLDQVGALASKYVVHAHGITRSTCKRLHTFNRGKEA